MCAKYRFDMGAGRLLDSTMVEYIVNSPLYVMLEKPIFFGPWVYILFFLMKRSPIVSAVYIEDLSAKCMSFGNIIQFGKSP